VKGINMKRFWLAIGKDKNWDTAFRNSNIWGLEEKNKEVWDNLARDDLLFFYVKYPLKGIIGYGTIVTVFRQDKPLWPEEIKKNQVRWPLRFEFDIEYCLPPDRWAGKSYKEEAWIKPRLSNKGFGLIDKELVSKVLEHFRALGDASEISKEFATGKKVEELPHAEIEEGTHELIKKRLVEIGKMQKFIAEPEYEMDGTKLDVVWRRVERSAPTYAFEVQVKGNIYQAVAKLKHAFDLWNSNIFLIAHKDRQEDCRNLLSGTFHEIRDRLIFIEIKDIEKLHALKKEYKNLEHLIGIL
jgi:predicted RNA-binding protein